MQSAVSEFVTLGRLPGDKAATVQSLQRLETLLDQISRPVTDNEARALAGCFGPDDCFGLAWSLLHAIETAPGWPLADALVDVDNEWIKRLRTRASL